MQKAGVISTFIFLTGLFAGLFFSTGLGPENHSHLSSLLLYGIYAHSGFIKSLTSSIIANFSLALLMTAALFTRLLRPLPFLLLFYKSFSLGFCSGLIHTASANNAFLISLLKIFPQNVFLIPAFILLAALTFSFSLSGSMKTNRLPRERESLKRLMTLVFILLLTGCITEAACLLIAL